MSGDVATRACAQVVNHTHIKDLQVRLQEHHHACRLSSTCFVLRVIASFLMWHIGRVQEEREHTACTSGYEHQPRQDISFESLVHAVSCRQSSSYTHACSCLSLCHVGFMYTIARKLQEMVQSIQLLEAQNKAIDDGNLLARIHELEGQVVSLEETAVCKERELEEVSRQLEDACSQAKHGPPPEDCCWKLVKCPWKLTPRNTWQAVRRISDLQTERDFLRGLADRFEAKVG
eukprot:4486556-Amphidinium_carterae.2